MNGIKLDHLVSFADVVELGSFSAAAERNGLTQPAISLQIRSLERRFGVRLIERVGRRARPTAVGREVLEHVARIRAEMDAALRAAARHSAGVAGRVHLATGATACIYLLPDLLRQLRQRFPALEIVVSTGDTADLQREIEANRVDVGLLTLPVSGAALAVTPLMEDAFVAVDAAANPRLPECVTPAVLSALPLVVYGPGGNTRRVVDRWFAQAGVPLRPVMELGNVEAIKELVGAGLGCAVLPGLAVPADGPGPRLIRRTLTPPLTRRLALVMRHDKPVTRALGEVVRALEGLAGGG